MGWEKIPWRNPSFERELDGISSIVSRINHAQRCVNERKRRQSLKKQLPPVFDFIQFMKTELPYLNEMNEAYESLYRRKAMQGKQSIFLVNSVKDLLFQGKGDFRNWIIYAIYLLDWAT